jgi:hypothetical protein
MVWILVKEAKLPLLAYFINLILTNIQQRERPR